MKLLYKLVTVLALAIGLTACQHTAPQRAPEAVDPVPPVVQQGNTGGAQSQSQSSVVITLHLAQEQKEDTLVAVDVGGENLYALPQPVLTQADLLRVTPVTTADQRTFLLLEMNQRGLGKLHSITRQAQGHFLLLSVQGQLASIARIGEVITDGRLLIQTQNAQHTQAILNMMKGG